MHLCMIEVCWCGWSFIILCMLDSSIAYIRFCAVSAHHLTNTMRQHRPSYSLSGIFIMVNGCFGMGVQPDKKLCSSFWDAWWFIHRCSIMFLLKGRNSISQAFLWIGVLWIVAAFLYITVPKILWILKVVVLMHGKQILSVRMHIVFSSSASARF